MSQKKTWGWSTRVLINEMLQVEHILVQPGGYSSVHLHEDKVNQFIVKRGTLLVNYFDEQLENDGQDTLHCGDSVAISVGRRHQFVAMSEVEGYEVYWTTNDAKKVEADDIVRFSENGVDISQASAPEVEVKYCSGCNVLLTTDTANLVEWNNAIRHVCMECMEHLGHDVRVVSQ